MLDEGLVEALANVELARLVQDAGEARRIIIPGQYLTCSVGGLIVRFGVVGSMVVVVRHVERAVDFSACEVEEDETVRSHVRERTRASCSSD